jgi:hypothetical protein
MLTDGLVALLNATPAITSIVGDHIQPIPAPEDLSQYPLITYQVASDVSEDAGDGPVGVAEARVVFACKAVRYHDARTLALELKTLLAPFIGALPDGTIVLRVKAANLVDGFDDESRISCTFFHALIQYGD